VALVIERLPRTGGAEGLAGARACPNRSVVGPSGETEGDGPSGDTGEEMALGVAAEIVGSHVNDASFVNVATGDVSGGDEVAEPLRCIGVDLVVVGGHSPPCLCEFRAARASSKSANFGCGELHGMKIDHPSRPDEIPVTW
jgi:hypothetical protein